VRKIECGQRIVAIDVKMGVDQSGEEREPLRIDHFRPGGDRYRGSCADRDNLFAANDHDCINYWRTAAAIDQGRADNGNDVVCIGLRYRIHFMKRLEGPSALALSRLRGYAARKKECDEYCCD
jgi:hypothetical protein